MMQTTNQSMAGLNSPSRGALLLRDVAQDLIQERYESEWAFAELEPFRGDALEPDDLFPSLADSLFFDAADLDPLPCGSAAPQAQPAPDPDQHVEQASRDAADRSECQPDDQPEGQVKPKPRFACPLCPGLDYSRRSDLRKHERLKHCAEAPPEFFCPYCLSSFMKRPNCLRHLRKGCGLAPKLPPDQLHPPMTEVFERKPKSKS